jgi:secretion/DNA translocation related TadE-like protein
VSARPARPSRRQDRGSATVLALVMVGVVVAVTSGVAVLGTAVVDQRRVEAAADLGALAGAAALQRGERACVAAASVVERNGGRLSRCEPAGWNVTVRVTRPTRTVLGMTWTVSSVSRAGPAP